MCVYASFILRPKLVINWTKDDSHEKCISALKIKDDKDGVKRRFLRVECANGDIANFTVDETEEGELPVWYLDSENAYRAKCESLLKKINPIHAQCDTLDAAYDAQCDTLDAAYEAQRAPLYAAYEAQRAPLYAAYEAQRAPLDAAYDAQRDTLYAAYEAQRDTLYAAYKAQRDPLDAAYDAQRDTLYAAYEAQRAPLYAAYEEIEGYVKI